MMILGFNEVYKNNKVDEKKWIIIQADFIKFKGWRKS